MWSTLLGLLGSLGGVVAPLASVFLAFAAGIAGLFAFNRLSSKAGADKVRAQLDARAAAARAGQIDAALDRPRDGADLDRRLRDPGHPF